MKVFFLVLGTRGDLELFLKLAQELQKRGHRIIFGTSSFYQARVREVGLKWFPMGEGSFETLRTVLESLGRVEDKLARSRIYLKHWLRSELAKAKKQIALVGMGSDYFISNLQIELKREGQVVPGASVCYDPPESVNILPDFRHYQGQILNLVAMNQALIDPHHQWNEVFKFTGFWLSPPVQEWNAPPALQRFLAAGSPPVVLTMGSMAMFGPQRLVKLFQEALIASSQRGIIIGGWSQPEISSSKSLYYAPEIPYSWLFPQVSAVIHHGGVGTVAEALRAGKQSIVLPQVQCQAQFADILQRENLAMGCFDVETLSPEALVTAINKALDDTQVQRSTQHWQQLIQQESGLKTAADLIEVHWRRLQNS